MPLNLQEKYRLEQAKWNALAPADVSASMVLPPNANFETHARQSSLYVGVLEFLGDLCGEQVLEYGCGLGELATLLAKSGAQVTAFDLAPRSVRIAQRRAKLNQVEASVKLMVAAGEHVPFADESFGVIVGKAILHHLDVNVGWSDLYRVLKRGGRAVFIEPMGMNPILNFVRDHVPYRHKHPRGADSPLIYAEIHEWGRPFEKFSYREIQLLSMLERGLGFRRRISQFRRLDALLLERLPWLRRYCRYVVMYCAK
ncbi:MAG: methyltransferase domain-containing protein [Anaerolineales bacterium]